jgi:hypothetical protein
MFKQTIVDLGLSVLLNILKSKPDSKLASFLFSEKMQRTISEICQQYLKAVEDFESGS